MSTRAQIRANIQANLADVGLGTFYTPTEIDESIQDAYNEVVAKTLCNIKMMTLSWPATPSPYYDFITTHSVTDYLGTYAIFNNNTNFWLRDDVSLRDLDRIRRDWELWRGQPQFWCPHSLKRIVIVPNLLVGGGTFNLWYYAIAPVMTADSDVPIIAADEHVLIAWYSTADLIETAEEPAKAAHWWGMYEPAKEEYKQRCHNVAQAQLLLRI